MLVGLTLTIAPLLFSTTTRCLLMSTNMDMEPEPIALDQKKARLDPGDGTGTGTGTGTGSTCADVAMETTTGDSSEAVQEREPLIYLKPTTATGVAISDSDIVKRLRPIVRNVEDVQDDLASLRSSLKELDFLEHYDAIMSAPKDAILKQVNAVYLDARKREAKTYVTFGAINPKYLVSAIEIRNAILYSKLKYIKNEQSGMQIYNGDVPDVQNPGDFTRVVVRDKDEAFWKQCIELSLQDHPVCGVGNPGIGKTSTTLYLLQQLIMVQNKPVVYTIRKKTGPDIFYEFVPIIDEKQVKDITVKVYRLMASDKKSEIQTMENPKAFYVVDPGDFEGSCNDTDEHYKARFVMAASNDHRHWGGHAFKKDRGKPVGVLVYGSLWTARGDHSDLLVKHSN